MDELARGAFAAWSRVEPSGAVALDAPSLAQAPAPLANRVAGLALRRAGSDPRRIATRHIEALIDLARGGSGREAHLPGGIVARKARRWLRLTRERLTGALRGLVEWIDAPFQRDPDRRGGAAATRRGHGIGDRRRHAGGRNALGPGPDGRRLHVLRRPGAPAPRCRSAWPSSRVVSVRRGGDPSRIELPAGFPVAGADLLVVEDILDTGCTLAALRSAPGQRWAPGGSAWPSCWTNRPGGRRKSARITSVSPSRTAGSWATGWIPKASTGICPISPTSSNVKRTSGHRPKV